MQKLQQTLEQKLPRERFFSAQYQDFSLELAGVTIECDELFLKLYGFSRLSLDIPQSFDGLTLATDVLNQLEEKMRNQERLPYEMPCYLPNAEALMVVCYCLVQAERRLTEKTQAGELGEVLILEELEEIENGFL